MPVALGGIKVKPGFPDLGTDTSAWREPGSDFQSSAGAPQHGIAIASRNAKRNEVKALFIAMSLAPPDKTAQSRNIQHSTFNTEHRTLKARRSLACWMQGQFMKPGN